MRVADAIHLKRGDLLLCFRIGTVTYKPPIVVRFESTIHKTKKKPAQLTVRWQNGSVLSTVNVRDVDFENPLERMAAALRRKG